MKKKINIIIVFILFFTAGCAYFAEKTQVENQEITVRVRDFDTKMPLKNAKIMETRILENEVRSKKTQDRGIGLTNADGVFYTDAFNFEHVSRFGISAEGYHDEWLDIDSFSPGGNYEFELKKKEDF
jgi:hypothetical protein